MPKVVYYVENDENNTLSHYGRLGMKWGQHIFTDDDLLKYPSSRRARKAARALNKLDEQRAKYYFKAVQPSEKKYKNAKYKRIKAERKGKADKITKAKTKEKDAEKRYKQTLKEMENGKKAVSSLLKKLEKNGQYDITSKEFARVRSSGADYTSSALLFGIPGVLVTAAVNAADPNSRFQGTYYNVKRKPQV